MLRRHQGIASLFFFAGGAISCAFLSLVCFSNAYHRGAAPFGRKDVVLISGTVIPYALYFVAGVEAAMVTRRLVRQLLGACAHAAPFFSLLFVRPEDFTFMVTGTLITFILFGLAWFYLLAEKNNES